MRPHFYVIIGCGHFGSKAVEKLIAREPGAKIIAIDKNERGIKEVSHPPIQTIICDGLLYLDKFLSESDPAGYIIPAVPFHLAFEFILSQLKPWGAKRKEIPSLSDLPNPVIGKTGDLYTSLANFLCPEDCLAPSQYCTMTGERRRKPLYKILKDLPGTFESKVIRSRQLGPGIGGYRAEALLDLLEEIKKRTNSSRTILISTASRCHGVTSGLSF